MRLVGDVILVGGGPAGAAAAYWLAREGLDVTLVDRARFPREKPCAEYLGPEALRLLGAIGALGAVERVGGARLSGMKVRAPDGTEFGARVGGLGVPRVDLDSLLVDHARAAGVRVVEGFRVTAIHHEDTKDAKNRPTGIVGLDADGARRVLRAFVVIGSDGLRSIVARRLGLARRSRLPERYAMVAHFAGVSGVTDQVEMHVERDGYVGIADIGQGCTSVAMVVPSALMSRAREGAGPFLLSWLNSHPHLAARFAAAGFLSEVQATGPFASRAARAWAPGAALVGDAAGFFDPITGQGVASALRGAALLAPFVTEAVRSGNPKRADEALAAYSRAHARSFRSQWLVDKCIALVVAHPTPMNRIAHLLHARQEMADLLLGVTSGSRPTHEVLRLRFLFDLLRPVAR